MTSLAIQALDWEIEGAADPLALIAHGRSVLYGSRTGQIIRWFSRPLPAMMCLGFNTAPGQVVLTAELAKRTTYSMAEESTFERILLRATGAIESGNLEDLATAATDSARLNQERLACRNFESIVQLAQEAGALGVSISHSGTVATAIFAPTVAGHDPRVLSLTEALRALGCDAISPFRV